MRPGLCEYVIAFTVPIKLPPSQSFCGWRWVASQYELGFRVGGLAWVRQKSTLKESSKTKGLGAPCREKPLENFLSMYSTVVPRPTLLLSCISLSQRSGPSSIRTEDPTCVNHVDVLTV